MTRSINAEDGPPYGVPRNIWRPHQSQESCRAGTRSEQQNAGGTFVERPSRQRNEILFERQNQEVSCGAILSEKQHDLGVMPIQKQDVDSKNEKFVQESTRNMSDQQLQRASGKSSVGPIGHTEIVVGAVRSDPMQDTNQKHGSSMCPKVKTKRTASGQSKLYPFRLPKQTDNHTHERINNISRSAHEIQTELKRACEKANIPLSNSSQKKRVSCKRNMKSVYVVTLTDEDQSLRLEPMSKPNVGRQRYRPDKNIVNNLKFSLRKAKQWSIFHKGDHIKEMKKRKRTRERKTKSAVIKSLKRNWKNTHITAKRLDQDGRKMSLHPPQLKDVLRKWHIRPETLSIHVYPISRSLDPYFQSLENSNTNSTTETAMEIEWLRLNSFANSSRNIEVRPIFLARAGFYYTGHTDEVQCYSCGLTHRNWRFGDDPYRIHRNKSPNCRHMSGNDARNIPIPREHEVIPNNQSFQTEGGAEHHVTRLDSSPMPENPSLPTHETEVNRSTTGIGAASVQTNITQATERMFVNQDRALPVVRSPNDNIQVHSERETPSQELPDYQQHGFVQRITTSNNLSQNGASTTHTSNNNQNQQRHIMTYCSGNRPNPHIVQNGMPTITRATANRANQTLPNGMVNGADRQNVQTQRSQQRAGTDVSTATMRKLAPLGVNFDKPKYPAYAILPVRMSSYSGWTASQTPNLMAEAGFVYAGYADYTRCFFCGGGLRNWEAGDDPWVEHARWFPRCSYLRQNKGDEFIQLVHEQLDREEGNIPNTQQSEESADVAPRGQGQTYDTEEMHSLPAYQSLIENGYNPKMIHVAIRNLRRKGEEIIDAITIVEEIYRMEETGDQCIDDVTNVMDDDTNDENNLGTRTPDADVHETINQEMKEIQDLMEENRKLKREKMCRICEEEDASIAFLPCAHLVCCQVCSQAVRRCPVCGQVIQGTVKTWLG